jgi:hypothetical protein
VRARFACGEIGGERGERRLHACAGRECTIESHVEEAALDDIPWLLAHHQVAAHIEQDVVETRFNAQVAEAAAIELALAIERRDENRIGRGFDCRAENWFRC